MARFTRHTNVITLSFTSYALVRSKLLLVMVKTRIPWPRTFLFTFQSRWKCSFCFSWLDCSLSTDSLVDSLSVVWRDCDVLCILFFFFSFLERERVKERTWTNDPRVYSREAIPAQTLPRTRSVRSSFILAPSRCCPTMGPLSSSTPTRSTSFFSIHSAERNDNQPREMHVVSYLNC